MKKKEESKTRFKSIILTVYQNATADFHSMDILVSMSTLLLIFLLLSLFCLLPPAFPPLIEKIDYLQQNEAKTNIFVKYATLSDYFAAVKAVPDMTFPSDNGDDFFPLNESGFWTVIHLFPSISASLAFLILLPCLPSSFYFYLTFHPGILYISSGIEGVGKTRGSRCSCGGTIVCRRGLR